MSKPIGDVLTLLSALKGVEITTPEITSDGIPEGSKFNLRFIPKEVETSQTDIDELIEILQDLKLQKPDKATSKKIASCKNILSPSKPEKKGKWSDVVVPRENEELLEMEEKGEIRREEYKYGDKPPPLYFVGHTPRRPFRFQWLAGGNKTLVHGIDADGFEKNICINPKNKLKKPHFYFAV